ncbi:MAG: uroporphyrinogen decarboxylase family protein [Caldilineaceae bacterium]
MHVGKNWFDEDTFQHSPKRIENLFGCEFSYYEGSTPWPHPPPPGTPAEFACSLDQNLSRRPTWRRGAFPPGSFLEEWEERRGAAKRCPSWARAAAWPGHHHDIGARRDVFYWMYDHPDLMARFRDILAAKMVESESAFCALSGKHCTPGWWITDDNSALFNRAFYREYCFPVLDRVLDALAPGDAPRYQHSDSSMGHLLDMQYELGIRRVNYGPEVDAGRIRAEMPDALIEGQMPPFLLRNGSPAAIEQRVIDDFGKAGAGGGLQVATAGSLAAGTGVGRMRWFMQLVQTHCRYDCD